MDDMSNWITEKLEEGYSEEKVKQALLEEGYRDSVVESMFEDVHRKGPQKVDMTWFEIAKEVFVRPTDFFDGMPTSRGYGAPLKFLTVNLTVFGLIFAFLFVLMFSSVLTLISNFIGFGNQFIQLLLSLGFISVPLSVLSVLVYGIFSSLVLSIFVHPLLKLFGGKSGFEGTFRVISYVSIFIIFGWIPLLNMILGLYAIYVIITGYSSVHDISRIKSFLAIVSLSIILLFVGFGINIFMGTGSFIPQISKLTLPSFIF
ncbi:MAG: YIP1 family protein [Candidatus Aenigmatarchaeota archaeon]